MNSFYVCSDKYNSFRFVENTTYIYYPKLSIRKPGSSSINLYHRIRHTERRSTRVTAATPWFIIKMLTPWSYSPCTFERHSPLDVRHFEYYQGGECLSNAHWLGPWREHLVTNYGLRQNHRKIIGKTKKSAFCVPYSVSILKFFSSYDLIFFVHLL